LKSLSHFIALLLLAALAARAQDSDGSPIVEDKMIVRGDPSGAAAAGAIHPALEDAQPIASQSWDGLTERVANFQVESAGPSSFGSIFTLRGLANTPYFSDSAVAVYFDNIPLGSSFTYPTDLFGFASASVFLGPQGTAFGRAGEGGVILLQLPEPAAAGGELRVGAGDYDASSFAFQAGGSAGPRADATVAAAYTQREGYITNTQLGQKVDDERALTALARGRFRPTTASEISVEVLSGRHRDGAQPLVPLDGPLYTVARAQEGVTDTDMLGAAVKAAFDTSAGHVTAVTSYTDWKLDPYEDWLVLPPPLDTYLTQSQETWSEELHITTDPRAGLAWSAGAWFSDSRTIGATDRSILGLIPIEVSDYHSTNYDAAVFGEAIFTPAPAWRASAGLRVERVDKDYYQDEQVPTAGLHYHFLGSGDFLLPKLAVSHAFAPDATAEASVSFGSKPGGFSPYTDKPGLIPFAAEHTVAFETGVDSLLAQRTVTLSARVFAYAIQNYQIERSFSSTDYFVATAPRAQSLGGEIEARWRPRPAWTLGAVAGITDITLREFNDPITGQSFAGDRAPYAPAYTADFSVAYRAVRGLFGRVDLVAKGKTFYTESENPAYAQGAYGLLNARAGYDNSRWRLTLYVDNLADRGYYSEIVPGVNSAAPGVPRIVGSEFSLKF
jgi:iron complex outermembrane receptor protein